MFVYIYIFRQVWLNYNTSTHTKVRHLAAFTNGYILVSVWRKKVFNYELKTN